MHSGIFTKRFAAVLGLTALAALICIMLPVSLGFASRPSDRALTSIAPYKAPGKGKQFTELGSGKFLVASRDLKDPRFRQTVILLIHYGPDGAMGLVINRPLKIKISEAFPKLGAAKDLANPIYYGGPVEMNKALHVLSIEPDGPAWGREVISGVYLGASNEALNSIATAVDHGTYRVYAGYAGWAPGQLDAELTRGGWTVAAAEKTTIFADNYDDLWNRLNGE